MPWPDPPGADPRAWDYPAVDWLAQRLDGLPPATRKLLVFVPVHHLYPRPGSRGAAMMEECKRRVAELALHRPNVTVIDFAIPSAITTEDDRWWDAMHARVGTLDRVSDDLARIVSGGASDDAQLLVRSDR